MLDAAHTFHVVFVCILFQLGSTSGILEPVRAEISEYGVQCVIQGQQWRDSGPDRYYMCVDPFKAGDLDNNSFKASESPK